MGIPMGSAWSTAACLHHHQENKSASPHPHTCLGSWHWEPPAVWKEGKAKWTQLALGWADMASGPLNALWKCCLLRALGNSPPPLAPSACVPPPGYHLLRASYFLSLVKEAVPTHHPPGICVPLCVCVEWCTLYKLPLRNELP